MRFHLHLKTKVNKEMPGDKKGSGTSQCQPWCIPCFTNASSVSHLPVLLCVEPELDVRWNRRMWELGKGRGD